VPASQKEAPQAAYGRALTSEPMPGKRACRIAAYRRGTITRPDEHDARTEFFPHASQRMRNSPAAAQIPE
jgi:hypothetical protein